MRSESMPLPTGAQAHTCSRPRRPWALGAVRRGEAPSSRDRSYSDRGRRLREAQVEDSSLSLGAQRGSTNATHGPGPAHSLFVPRPRAKGSSRF